MPLAKPARNLGRAHALALLVLLAVWTATGDVRAQTNVECVPACTVGQTCVAGTCMVPAPPAASPPATAPTPASVPDATPAAAAPPTAVPAVASPPPAAQIPDGDAPAIAPAVAPTTQARALRTAPVEQSPALDRTRDGLVFLPFLGLHSFQDSNYSALSAGLRVGTFIGAFVNNDWSLNASATLDILDVSENVPAGTTVDNGGEVVSLAFSPLFHVGNPKAEFVIGPILGGWAEWVHATDTESPETAAATGLISSSAHGWEAGWTVGGNMGVFIPVSSGVRAGALLTLERRGVLHQCVELTLTEQPAVGGTIGIDGTSGGGSQDSCQSSGPGATVLGFTFALLL